MICLAEEEYHIKFPKVSADFSDNELTFSINHIKSRELSTLYFYFRAYDIDDELIYTYESDRWIIDPVYRHKEDTFTIPQEIADTCISFQIEMVAVDISSENPLQFNEVMFQEGEFVAYHIPREAIKSWEVKLNKNSYANLYGKDGEYLQVIRPLKDSFFTDRLVKSECTVLAPHLYDEPRVDSPVNLFLEFSGQREQRIDVLR